MACFLKFVSSNNSDKAANLGKPGELSNPIDPANKYHGGVHRVIFVNETENGTLPGGFPFPKPPEGGHPFRVFHHLHKPIGGGNPFWGYHHPPKHHEGPVKVYHHPPKHHKGPVRVYHHLPKHHGGPVRIYHHYPKPRRNANRH